MGSGGQNSQPRAQDRKRPPQGSLEASAPKKAKSHNNGNAVPMHQKPKNASSRNSSGASTPGPRDFRGGKGGHGGEQQSNGRFGARPSIRDVRAIAVNKGDPAVKDCQLDVQSFVDARSFELKALTESMRRTKGGSSSRAFQIVPITLRRRTAAHNHKRVPKRLRGRAKREMAQDNTPTVNSKTRKPGSTRSRLRAENARKLGLLSKRKKALKLKKPGLDNKTVSLRAARPKIRRNTLNDPVVTNRKFRRRQINKTWLPTHLWHTKRARMTEPSKPFWRFAIPLTPSNKSYRPAHRAQFDRGALAWDMSYMSTIGLAGRFSSVRNILKALGLNSERLWDEKSARWRSGAVHWSGLLSKQVATKAEVIGPATIIWNPTAESEGNEAREHQNRLFIRIHPSIFFETFNELLRLARMTNPRPYIEDLRYEIGSIEMVGADSTEALMAVLKPWTKPLDDSEQPQAADFHSLSGLKDPSSLPSGSMFAFSVLDPRLAYPFQSRRIGKISSTSAPNHKVLYETLSNIHRKPAGPPIPLFDRDIRFKASQLPSQKSLNRRKGKGAPGAALQVTPADPPIPIIVLASRHPTDAQAPGSWTVMLPWKCVLPLWYCLMHYPLSTGGNPQFGGLDEMRQLTFERGLPWFPGDVSGTAAGNAWELEQRELRLKKWERMPKGKRHNYETLDLGACRKGEIGQGWSCAYELLFGDDVAEMTTKAPALEKEDVGMDGAEVVAGKEKTMTSAATSPLVNLSYLPKSVLNSLSPANPVPPKSVVSIRIRMITKGTPLTCARIYRLPTKTTPGKDAAEDITMVQDAPTNVPASIPEPAERSKRKALPVDLYDQWLALLPKKHTQNPASNRDQAPSQPKKNMSVEDRQRLIARQLTAPLPEGQSMSQMPPPSSAFAFAMGDKESSVLNGGHPLCPDEHDLIGFVTKGEFNLRDGRGEGIGCLSAQRAIEELGRYRSTRNGGQKKAMAKGKGKNIGKESGGGKDHDSRAERLCVVRNAGEAVGRLARWEITGL